MQNKVDKRPMVFLDETWANSHDRKDLAWVENDTVTGGTLGGKRGPSGKGVRLIILCNNFQQLHTCPEISGHRTTIIGILPHMDIRI